MSSDSPITFHLEDLDKEIEKIKQRIELDTRTIQSLLETRKYLGTECRKLGRNSSLTKSSKEEEIRRITELLRSEPALLGATICSKLGIPQGSISYYLRAGTELGVFKKNPDKTWSLMFADLTR